MLGQYYTTIHTIVNKSASQFILASASPRRKQLLEQIGARFDVFSVAIDETPLLNEEALDYVQRVAVQKAAASYAQSSGELQVLAADTCVVIDDSILGKPDDFEHAYSMLKRLSGKTHHVYTAVCLQGETINTAVSMTQVSFKPLNDAEIHTYWRSGEPVGKAGGYAIQGLAAMFVQSIHGSYSGVVGLPLYETTQLLKQQGIDIINE